MAKNYENQNSQNQNNNNKNSQNNRNSQNNQNNNSQNKRNQNNWRLVRAERRAAEQSAAEPAVTWLSRSLSKAAESVYHVFSCLFLHLSRCINRLEALADDIIGIRHNDESGRIDLHDNLFELEKLLGSNDTHCNLSFLFRKCSGCV